MMTLKLSVLAAILSIGLVSGQDPTAQIKINTIKVNNVAGNPLFDDWSAEIHSPDTISIKTPVKKDLPDGVMIKALVTFAGSPVPEIEMLLCEAFEDETYGKEVLSNGIPKGVFPTTCPIKAGNNFVLSKYKFDSSQVPPGIPDGLFVADVEIYEPGNDPSVSIHVEGALTHKLPGFGR